MNPTSTLDLAEPIVTARLCLRRPTAPDAAAMAAYIAENRRHLGAFEGEPPPGADEAAFWESRFADFSQERADGRALRLLVVPASAPHSVIGTVSLLDVVRGSFQRCSFGAAIAQRAQGHGLMGEAAVALLRHAFDALGLHRIEGAYVAENERSARFVAALGFQVEGVARGYRMVHGRWVDHVRVGLLREDARFCADLNGQRG